MKYRLVIVASLLAILISFSGCASQPTFGDQLAGDSNEIANIGKQWNKGQKSVNEGEELIENGQENVEDGKKKVNKGEKQIKEGRTLVEKGQRLMQDSEQAYQTRNLRVQGK